MRQAEFQSTGSVALFFTLTGCQKQNLKGPSRAYNKKFTTPTFPENDKHKTIAKAKLGWLLFYSESIRKT
jgi:hypothetical protein